MLNVIFISRCLGPALSRTRRLLDAYARRTGDATWVASITQEGLESVQVALKRSASRKTAVACHGMSRQGARLLWIVGRRQMFGEAGTVPARSRASGHRALEGAVPFSELPRLVRVCRYGGFHHDTGKGTTLFKEKVRGSECFSDPVRHEWLSVYVNRALHAGKSYRDAIAWAADQVLTHAPQSAFLRLPETEVHLGEWLVATHHRLPDEDDVGELTCHQHVQRSAEDKQSKARSAKLRQMPAGADLFSDPGVEPALTAARLSEETIPAPMRDAFFLWGRLALMLGDHHVSSNAAAAPGVTGLLANARQDLAWHLLAIGSKAGHAARLLPRLESRLPALHPEERQGMEAAAPKRFAWQNEAARAAKSLADAPDAHLCGTFVVLCASTGSGKTRAGARLASVLAGPRMRLSTLLGLRTLTLQTGDAYRSELGLPVAQVATLIGSREIRALHRTENAPDAAQPLDEDEFDLEALVHGDVAVDLPEIITTQFRRQDDQQLLSAPVLVSTIDYLIQGGDWRRSRHLLPQLRLLTSDILLDEVDSYDLSDYPAIGRLCYLVGLFGRRLILSSATAMPELVAPLYRAYAEGWRAFAQLGGAKDEIQSLFVADHAAPEVMRYSSGDAFLAGYAAFTHKVAKYALKSTTAPIRRGRCESITSVPDLIAAIKRLHEDNATAIDAMDGSGDSQTVSAGLVRFAHVKDAVQVANRIALLRENLSHEGYRVIVVPYHAMLPLAVRAHTEWHLDRWLRRKFAPDKGELDPLLDAELVRAALNEGGRHIVLLVVATPVEEVGRDHDFDWAVIEPSSSRSIAQCAGRVNRHRRRPLPEECINIIVMKHNLRRLTSNEQRAVFSNPGFENSRRPFASQKDLPADVDIYDLSSSAAALVVQPEAASCLLSLDALETRGDWLAVLERKEIARQMKDALEAAFLSRPSSKYSTRHFCNYRFRKGEPSIDVYCNPESGKWHLTQSDVIIAFAHHAWPASAIETGFWLGPEHFQGVIERIAHQAGCPPDQAGFCSRYLRVSVPISAIETPSKRCADFLLGIYPAAPSALVDPS